MARSTYVGVACDACSDNVFARARGQNRFKTASLQAAWAYVWHLISMGGVLDLRREEDRGQAVQIVLREVSRGR